MLSIQIDTKSLKLVIYHQFNNIKLSFEFHMKSSFLLCTDIRYFRVSTKVVMQQKVSTLGLAEFRKL